MRSLVAGPCEYEVWDAATAKVVVRGKLGDRLEIGFGETASDLVLVVKPER